jgi:CubicO group peptidase (beta-lactamase class C family)
MRRNLLTVSMAILLASCGGGGGVGGGGIPNNGREPDVNPGLPASISIAPENTGDGWNPSTPASEGMNAAQLQGAMESIRDKTYTGVDSMLVVRHGRLVAEGYFNGFGRESLHDLRSTGKSVTSALAGIAIEQRLFAIDDPIARHIPQFDRHDNMSARKQAIQPYHLLNMNSGLDCNDWEPSSRGNEDRMYDSRDWVGFILDLPMAYDPGVASTYCTGGVVVLGYIISQKSGMALDAYANSYLFGPLGIRDSGWRRSPDGAATGGGGLRLRPRDAAKFGQLYLDGGTWNGARVVPEAWVQLSQQRVNRIGVDFYGYLWWKRSFSRTGGHVESYFTNGNGGNYVFVIPSLDLVVVFTGSNYNSSLGDQPFNILADRVLPAVQ